MDKIALYTNIIKTKLQTYALAWNTQNSPIKTLVIFDEKGKHFQLIRMGWRTKEDYIHNCIFHLDVIDGKVWIQENRSDIVLADELIKDGVHKKDIVLGMLPPQLREDSEYAIS